MKKKPKSQPSEQGQKRASDQFVRAGEKYRFQPGESGNPGGRPRDEAAEIARAIFEENKEAIYQAMRDALKKGNPKVFTALADRGYGKAPQPISVEGNEERPITFRVRFIRPKPEGSDT